jgi:hypothetical protein
MVERSLETYTDSESAQAAGRKRKAAMVIWGTYDDFGVTPRVELLRQPQLQEETTLPQFVLNAVGPATAEAADGATLSRLDDVSYLTRAPLASTNLDLFAAHGPEQMAYMVSAILATGLYVDGEYEDALHGGTVRVRTGRMAMPADAVVLRVPGMPSVTRLRHPLLDFDPGDEA